MSPCSAKLAIPPAILKGQFRIGRQDKPETSVVTPSAMDRQVAVTLSDVSMSPFGAVGRALHFVTLRRLYHRPSERIIYNHQRFRKLRHHELLVGQLIYAYPRFVCSAC